MVRLWIFAPSSPERYFGPPMIVEITLLLAAGLGNLAWDVTGRRISARSRRRSRRARRRESLPLPAADESATDPFATVVGVAPDAFVEQTRVTVEELDRVVDHFDLVLLRAQASESLLADIVYVGAEAPRERGRELLRTWLEQVAALPADLVERLRDLGLPDQPLEVALAREYQRDDKPRAPAATSPIPAPATSSPTPSEEPAREPWPTTATTSAALEATARDFESAVVMLVAFLRTLTEVSGDPY